VANKTIMTVNSDPSTIGNPERFAEFVKKRYGNHVVQEINESKEIQEGLADIFTPSAAGGP